MTNTIGNRYQLSKQLGRGGMGTIYLGVDTQTQTEVAIKQLHPDLTNREQIGRFQREGAALRELNHPNIVQMLDAFQDGDHYYLVMEYIRGGDLNQTISAGLLPPDQVVNMGIDLADALTRAHKLGIVHRDLKPANVLIADDGTLRLTDFGVAHVRHQDTLGDTNAVVGTVAYLSPEAIAAEEASERMDIWALGIMLYEMLTGETPFMRENIALTITAIMHDAVPDLSQLVPGISTELEDLIYRMLERDPQSRISSIRYVGAILEDIQQKRTTAASYTTRFEATTKFQMVAKHNLPVQITEFIGREAEIQEITRLLENRSQRLITILAHGGMGKTRIALETAQQNIAFYPDGVYFVELAPLDHPDKIVTAIATALSLSLSGSDHKQKLLQELSDKQALLVLDNWEHLLDAAPIVTDILQSAPHIQILATSRLRLKQMGEVVFHLSGMEFPDWETPADALDYAAVKLFMNSAKRARPGFELVARDLHYIARICRLVQGMPLGILLAAAWVAMLPPKEIADELQQDIDLLVDEVGELPERQQSIRVVMDYAWQSMTTDEQSVFAKLAIFRGGFTREAAQHIAKANLRTLMSLVNKSLIRRHNDSGRYEIHELLRQFAEEQLQRAFDYEETQQAHLDYFSRFLKTRFTPLRGSSRQFAIATEIQIEIQNIHRAWFYATAQADAEQMRPMLECLHHYYYGFATYFDADRFYQRTLDMCPSHANEAMAHIKQMILIHFAEALAHVGNPQRTLSLATGGLAYAEAHPEDLYMLHFALRTRSHLYTLEGDIEKAYQILQERLIPLAQKTADKFYYIDTLTGKSFVLSMRGVAYQAEMMATLQEALTVAEEIGDDNSRELLVNNISALTLAMGQWDEAERRIRLMPATQNEHYKSLGYVNPASEIYALARIHYIKGEFERSTQLAQQAFQQASEVNEYQYMARTTMLRGWIAQALGNFSQGIAHFEESRIYTRKGGSYHDVRASELYLLLTQHDHSPSTVDRHTLLTALLNALNDYQLMVRLDAVLGFARIKHHDGDHHRATELLGCVFEHPKRPPLYLTYAPLDNLRKNLQLSLSTDDYHAAYQRGAVQDFETAVQTLQSEAD